MFTNIQIIDEILKSENEPLEGELWKLLPDYEDRYAVSNMGRVFGFDKTVKCIAGKLRTMHGKMLSLTLNKTGYLRCAIGKNRSFKTRVVHRLVAKTFIPNLLNKPWINHKDGIKTNNVVSNLEWSTPTENNQHAQDTGLNRARFSRKQKNAVRKFAFKKGHIPWNKNKKGLQIGWNKGTKGLQVAWNKGMRNGVKIC
jgi:hypothetical protein